MDNAEHHPAIAAWDDPDALLARVGELWRAHKTKAPKFKPNDLVEKWTGDYTGPGRVRGVCIFDNGKLRYLVGHRIEGGTGEFFHIYAEGNLREPDGDTA